VTTFTRSDLERLARELRSFADGIDEILAAVNDYDSLSYPDSSTTARVAHALGVPA
jgi:hypothetical protein